jgi:hypothetical protein
VNIDQNVPYMNDQAERLDNNSIMIEGVLYTRNTPPELAPEVQQVCMYIHVNICIYI